jgi:hypothetical protein
MKTTQDPGIVATGTWTRILWGFGKGPMDKLVWTPKHGLIILMPITTQTDGAVVKHHLHHLVLLREAHLSKCFHRSKGRNLPINFFCGTQRSNIQQKPQESR